MFDIYKKMSTFAIIALASFPVVAQATDLTANFGTTGAPYYASELFQVVEAGNPYNDTPRLALYDQGGRIGSNASALPPSTPNYSIAAVFTTTGLSSFSAGLSSSITGVSVGFNLFKGGILIDPGVAGNNGENILPVTLNPGIYSLVVSGNLVNHEAAGLFTFTGSPVAAAVPEPSTWAMLLAGFGVLGMAARLRRRHGVAFAYRLR